jgi:hypothetical protein
MNRSGKPGRFIIWLGIVIQITRPMNRALRPGHFVLGSNRTFPSQLTSFRNSQLTQGRHGPEIMLAIPGFGGGQPMRRPIDVATMFGVLWLLGSMIVDVLTPKELTVYMIAAATAPAAIVVGLCYYLQFPMIDFTVIFATFWLTAALAIEWISPKPLPSFIIAGGLAPALIAGAVLHWRRYRCGENWRRSADPRAARQSNPGTRASQDDAETQDRASAPATPLADHGTSAGTTLTNAS